MPTKKPESKKSEKSAAKSDGRRPDGVAGAHTASAKTGGAKTGGTKTAGASTSARSTVSGPAHGDGNAPSGDLLVMKMEGTEALAAAMPFNANKAGEYGSPSLVPATGATVEDA